jgi:hypothetical protein
MDPVKTYWEGDGGRGREGDRKRGDIPKWICGSVIERILRERTTPA